MARLEHGAAVVMSEAYRHFSCAMCLRSASGPTAAALFSSASVGVWKSESSRTKHHVVT